MYINQSFTLLQKNAIYINQKPLKRFPTQFLQTQGALQTEDSHRLGLRWVAVSAGISLLPQQSSRSVQGQKAVLR